jgi:Bacterial transcriptional regulator
MQKLKEIRDAGFALSDDEVTLRMADVSAPIFDHRGDVMASLPVSGLRNAILHQPDSSSSIIDLAREGGTTAFNLFWCPRVPHLASLTQPRLLHPALPAGSPRVNLTSVESRVSGGCSYCIHRKLVEVVRHFT